MKKLISLILCIVLTLSITACGDKKENIDSTEATQSSTVETNQNITTDVTESTNTQTEPSAPSETIPTESTETVEPFIKFEDFGKDNDVFYEAIEKMILTDKIVFVYPNDTKKCAEINFKTKCVIDKTSTIQWYVDYVSGKMARNQEFTNAVEITMPIDYYARVDVLYNFNYVKIDNMLYGATSSVNSCQLIKITLNEDGTIARYETSNGINYNNWDHDWENEQNFNLDHVKYEYK